MRRFVDESTAENAYEQALMVLESVGIRFENQAALKLFINNGAKVDGARVFIPKRLVQQAVKAAPKQVYNFSVPPKALAGTAFSTAPFILDDDTGPIRRCTLADAVKLYKFNETSPLYECANPGCADPADNDAPDLFVGQIAMMLKYSDKYPSLGLRATGSTSAGGDVYKSAKGAIRLIREFYDIWDKPVMTQCICPNPPLTYDRECLDNLNAALDEAQAVSIVPCSLGFMTGPESLMGVAVQDFALSMAGLVYINLKSPGHPVSFCTCSTICHAQTMQPSYGSVESVFIQVIYYELCRRLGLPCTIGGGYGDGLKVDYQAGLEAALTALLPFNLTDICEIWCSPGLLADFALGSFHKAILDEEMIRYTNRMLTGADLTIDPQMPGLMAAGLKAGSFLTVGSMDTYRRDNYLTKVFNKSGIGPAGQDEKNDPAFKARQAVEKRLASYEPPQRCAAQQKLLQPHLPSKCRDECLVNYFWLRNEKAWSEFFLIF